METQIIAQHRVHLYLVRTIDGRHWYALGAYTQEAEEAVQAITGKNTVASCTPVQENAMEA